MELNKISLPKEFEFKGTTFVLAKENEFSSEVYILKGTTVDDDIYGECMKTYPIVVYPGRTTIEELKHQAQLYFWKKQADECWDSDRQSYKLEENLYVTIKSSTGVCMYTDIFTFKDKYGNVLKKLTGDFNGDLESVKKEYIKNIA